MAAETEAASLADADRESLVETIERIARESGEEGLTLRALFEALGERAFGAILFALALPVCIPFLYGVPQVLSLPMMVFAGQMAAGRHEPWMPGKFADRTLSKASLMTMAKWGRRLFGWAERIARPRLVFLTGPRAERVVGAVLVVFCSSILVPLPSTNTVPGFATALAAFGLMERDGLLVLLGLILGTLWVAALVFGALFFGTLGMSALADAVRGLF